MCLADLTVIYDSIHKLVIQFNSSFDSVWFDIFNPALITTFSFFFYYNSNISDATFSKLVTNLSKFKSDCQPQKSKVILVQLFRA